jgi:hypothetical protein
LSDRNFGWHNKLKEALVKVSDMNDDDTEDEKDAEKQYDTDTL